MYWCAGDSFNEVARKLSVAEATAQVYVIDLLADGFGNDNNRVKALHDMEVTKQSFDAVSMQTRKSGITLREIKEVVTYLKYNQIRVVIACLMHGTHM